MFSLTGLNGLVFDLTSLAVFGLTGLTDLMFGMTGFVFGQTGLTGFTFALVSYRLTDAEVGSQQVHCAGHHQHQLRQLT